MSEETEALQALKEKHGKISDHHVGESAVVNHALFTQSQIENVMEWAARNNWNWSLKNNGSWLKVDEYKTTSELIEAYYEAINL